MFARKLQDFAGMLPVRSRTEVKIFDNSGCFGGGFVFWTFSDIDPMASIGFLDT